MKYRMFFLVECVFSVIAKNLLPISRSQIFSVFSSRSFIVFFLAWFDSAEDGSQDLTPGRQEP